MMIAYLMLLSTPEWKALPREHRRFVYEKCVHPLLTTILAMGVKTLLFAAIAYAGIVSGLINHLSTSLAFFVTACFVPSELVDLIVVARNHAAINEFIKGHASALSKQS
jgi:cytochrome c oxidase assembly factor CtaG